ncbi:MAG TPA: hypothetical protein VMU80_11420 [Bryobacteraceae bacterium]|nr:hypothetical protein [Bryobacteraceae bacterium]
MKLRAACFVVGFLSFVLSLAAQTPSSSSASAQAPPPLIQFSSVASDESGTPLSGVVNITFSLYSAQQGGEPLWTETQNDIPLDPTGHYSVQLGITQSNGVPTALFTTGEAHWLGVQISGQAEQPRVLLLSVPYALKAGDAATIGGLPPSAFVMANPAQAAMGTAAATSAANAPASAKSSTVKANTITGQMGFIPYFYDTTGDLSDSNIFQSPSGNIGIGIEDPVATLDLSSGTINAGAFYIGRGLFAYAARGGDVFLGGAGGTAVFGGGLDTGVGSGALSSLYGAGKANTAVGFDALWLDTTGSGNSASGAQALYSNLSGGANTATGYLSLFSNTKGNYNTGTGNQTLYSNTSGTENTATGYQALHGNKTGELNTASGYEALYSNNTGSNNTASGPQALYSNTTGSYNSALGYLAGTDSTTPALTNSTAIGAYADVAEENALVLGSISGTNGCSFPACKNTMVGIGTTAPQATLDVEAPTGFTPTVNFGNTSNPAAFTVNGTLSVGGPSGMSIASDGIITFAPGQSLGGGGGITSTGTASYLPLFTSPSSVANSSVSENANGNIGISTSAGYVPNSTLDVNGTVNAATAFNLGGTLFAFGSPASGNSNAFLGFAGNTTMTGSQNTAVGLNSLAANTTGNNNVALGFALSGVNTGNANVGIGFNTLNNVSSGAFYSALGFDSGQILDNTNGTGIDNTALGSGAAFSTGTLNNATAVGSNAEVAESNALVLGAVNGVNGGTSVNVGIGTTTPTYPLDVAGIIRSSIGGFMFPDGTTQTTAYTGGGGGGINSVTGTNGVNAVTNNGTVTLSANEAVVAFQTDLTNGINTAETFATNAANTAQTNAETYANSTFVPLVSTGNVTETVGQTLNQSATELNQSATASLNLTSNGTAQVSASGPLSLSSSLITLRGPVVLGSGPNVIQGLTTIAAPVQIPATGTATASQGYDSNPLSFTASSYNSGTGQVNPQFFLQAEPSGNGTANASGTLNLLFGSGGTPTETGLSIASNGIISFANGQTFPGGGGGGITSVTGTNGVNAVTSGGAVTLSANEAVVAFQTDLTNGINTAETFATNAANTAQTNAETYANSTFIPLTESGAFATLLSNSFNGSQSVTGNISLTGTLTLPNTTSSTAGVIIFGKTPFVHNYPGGLNSYNTFVGSSAGNMTMNTSSALENTVVGASSFTDNTTGYDNSVFGAFALRLNTTGYQNNAFGEATLQLNTTGYNNNGFGLSALGANTTGSGNSGFGNSALAANETGTNNTAVGNAALYQLGVTGATGGSSNIAVGFLAGGNYTGTESNNIDIGNQGTKGESGIIRIGTPGTHTATYLAGNVAATAYTDYATGINVGLSTSCTSNQVMQWNGSAWACATVGGSGGITSVQGTAPIAVSTSGGSATVSLNPSDAITAVSVDGDSSSAGANGVYGDNSATMGQSNGVYGSTYSPAGTGTVGVNFAATGPAYGVYGQSNAGVGVYGTGPTDGVVGSSSGTGVYGSTTSATGYGVLGINNNTASGVSTGVFGQTVSTNGYAVVGLSGSTDGGVGVYGQTSSTGNDGAGVTGLFSATTGTGAGVFGQTNSYYPGAAGVFGTATNSSGPTYGVEGATSSSAGWGVYGLGQSPSDFYFSEGSGVWGDSYSGAGVIGTSANGVAGVFSNESNTNPTLSVTNYGSGGTGNVTKALLLSAFGGSTRQGCTIDDSGTLNCEGTVNAVVPTDNGAHKVALYAVQSPENWFEDFGSGQLVNGAAAVALDSVYAQTVSTDVEYHVFLTPRGECEGLYVGATTASGFEVRELHHGTSNIKFDYRIVARRKGYEAIRLADKTEQFDKIMQQLPRAHEPGQGAKPRPALAPHAPITPLTPVAHPTPVALNLAPRAPQQAQPPRIPPSKKPLTPPQ